MAAPTSVAHEVTETFQVDGMTCDHCARAVTEELNGICGVLRVKRQGSHRRSCRHQHGTPHHR
jgi:cation transport ATPase